MHSLLEIFSSNGNLSSPPIWLMRQAGRYMSEYNNVRGSLSSFLELCYDPKKVTEVTMQPIRRFGFDAAIIFSDILVLPDALGWEVEFQKNIGPVLKQFKSDEDFKFLNRSNSEEKLSNVYEAISLVKNKLPKSTPLIGFIGSPWTVVSYMIEGRGKHDFVKSKKFLYENQKLAKKLINYITEESIVHLSNQIKAGADIVQLFDSWSGVLSGQEYEDFVIHPTTTIVKAIKEQFPKIPIIGFPKGSGMLYDKYIVETGVHAVGVDQFVPIEFMKKWQEKIVVQGNLDPVVLLTNKSIIAKKVDIILSTLNRNNFIFNLGHGVLPTTPVENVEFLVNYVRNFHK